MVKFREPLGPKTTLKVGAADLYVIPGCLEDLTKTLQWALTSSKEVHFLGRGSNVLVPDEGVRGVVVSSPAKLSCALRCRIIIFARE